MRRVVAAGQLFLVMALALGGAGLASALTLTKGNLIVEAQRLENFSKTTYGEGSNSYVAPSGAEWEQFRVMAAALWNAEVATADLLATALDYEVQQFTHTNDQTVLYALRSKETNGVPVKGWGTYFVNTNHAVWAQVQAPHPQWDFRSPLLAADVFLKSGARGFLLAGAHRHVNGDSTGDPCDLTNTIFHAVHEAWNGTNGQNTAWQMHGFSIGGHPEFPSNAMAVLSTGDGPTNWMSTNIVVLDQRLEWNSVKSFAFNRHMDTNDAWNILVNEGLDGTNFTSLGARSNVQGIYSRGVGGTFVHVETVTEVRTNTIMRAKAADAIANAILLSRTNTPPALTNFSLTAVSLGTNSFVLQTPTERYRPCEVLSGTNVAATNWNVLYNFPGDGSSRLVTNALPAINGGGFYRLRGQ